MDIYVVKNGMCGDLYIVQINSFVDVLICMG